MSMFFLFINVECRSLNFTKLNVCNCTRNAKTPYRSAKVSDNNEKFNMISQKKKTLMRGQ